jgi:putative phosphoesterase
MQRTISAKDKYVIGVISDTHGLLRPEVTEILASVDRILHAGDIGGPDILASLREMAPVTAVRGNMDYGAWAGDLPETRRSAIGDKQLFMIHDIAGMGPANTGIQIVVSGHTHRPLIERKSNVLYLNPGSAGVRRRHYPVSLGLLYIDNGRLDAEIVIIDP